MSRGAELMKINPIILPLTKEKRLIYLPEALSGSQRLGSHPGRVYSGDRRLTVSLNGSQCGVRST